MAYRISLPLLLSFALLLMACTTTAGGTSTTTEQVPSPASATSPFTGPTPIPTPRTLTPLSPTPMPHPSPTAIAPEDELALLDSAQRAPRDSVVLARELGGQVDAPTVARTTPLEVQVGDVEQFWVVHGVDNQNYQVTAELRYSGPAVLMYVEQGVGIEQADLEQAAHIFEQQIYPRTRALFGSEWQPGVDGDPRITILNGRGTGGGVIGYFSSRDSLPRQVNRFSNEREMFYMNIGALNPASPAYLDTLAHEFQHMIHWNEQRRGAIWFNEGCATLAQDLNGFGTASYANTYLASPDVQLNAWNVTPVQSIAHYGAANLFMRYIHAHYASDAGLVDLIRADAGNHLDVFVQRAATVHADIANFGDLVANWALANLLNNPALADGRYSYPAGNLPTTIRPDPLVANGVQDSVHQFGVDYLQLPSGPHTLTFTGNTSVNLVGELPRGRYAWWSGRGDGSQATLTRAFDLRGLTEVTLSFDLWYELERGYDYGFVSVSTDGGTTWRTLRGSHTTSDDPQDMNYGDGFTGVSGVAVADVGSGERGRWIEETIDLTPYAGQEVLLRFWQINDEGFNAPGMLIDNLRILQLGYSDDVEAGTGGWQADGFVRVDGDLPQRWELRLVRTAADGTITIEPLPTDAQASAAATLQAGEQAVLMIVATTPHTTEQANYQITIESE